MAKKIFAFNLKMNKPDLPFNKYVTLLEKSKDVVYTCVPFVYLNEFKAHAKTLKYGAQNVSEFKSGSHTGEVSAQMLNEMGAKVCVVGHSERRKSGESDAQIAEKINRLLENKITPIICVGEEKEMSISKAQKLVIKQLEKLNLNTKGAKIIVAYEPVWAIGTGKVPTTQYIESMCRVIQEYLFDLELSAKVLYGGSYNEKNSKELNKAKNVDGFLIGGASLKESSIKAILNLD